MRDPQSPPAAAGDGEPRLSDTPVADRSSSAEELGGSLVQRPPVSVIIPAYTMSRLQGLQAAIAALRPQLLAHDELLIGVDHNEELRRALVETCSAGEGSGETVRVIASRNPKGTSGAKNAAMAVAHGELLVFLDDDAVPRRDWLARLIEPFADPDVIGVGGVAAPAWERKRPGWLPEEFLWVVGCSYRGLPEGVADIRNPIGATMAFRRSATEQTGGFLDGIGRLGRVPLGCEETEFAIRVARASGGRIVQQPTAQVDHLVTSHRMRVGYFVRRCWDEGLSKSLIAKITGANAALASERRYATRTLPAGVGAGLKAGLGGDRQGFQRAAAIIGGLAITMTGYLCGFATLRASRLDVTERSP
jgi:GT2 family glycosyltransferase